jgi:hypothetical protein
MTGTVFFRFRLAHVGETRPALMVSYSRTWSATPRNCISKMLIALRRIEKAPPSVLVYGLSGFYQSWQEPSGLEMSLLRADGTRVTWHLTRASWTEYHS